MKQTDENIYHVIKNIFDRLADAESKYIMKQRLWQSLSSDPTKLLEMLWNISTIENGLLLKTFYENKEKDKMDVVIFGAGNAGKHILHLFEQCNLKIWGFCDSSEEKQGQIVHGYPVCSPTYLTEKLHHATVVISSTEYAEEIKNQLKEMYFPEQRIICVCEKIYFAHFIPQGKEEIFVDAGCYDGKTIIDFRNWCNMRYKHIYAYEPDGKNYSKCKVFIDETDSAAITLRNAGLWSTSQMLAFSQEEKSSSAVDVSGNSLIKGVSLDEELQGKQITFLKMDIEGAELEALKGAAKTIQKWTPKLAISVYHKPEDILVLPQYILSLVPDYQFYLRHYSFLHAETVLYAVYERRQSSCEKYYF